MLLTAPTYKINIRKVKFQINNLFALFIGVLFSPFLVIFLVIRIAKIVMFIGSLNLDNFSSNFDFGCFHAVLIFVDLYKRNYYNKVLAVANIC